MMILKRIFTVLLLWAGLTTAAAAQPLVDADWVAGNLDNDNLVLIDLRNKIDRAVMRPIWTAIFRHHFILTI